MPFYKPLFPYPQHFLKGFVGTLSEVWPRPFNVQLSGVTFNLSLCLCSATRQWHRAERLHLFDSRFESIPLSQTRPSDFIQEGKVFIVWTHTISVLCQPTDVKMAAQSEVINVWAARHGRGLACSQVKIWIAKPLTVRAPSVPSMQHVQGSRLCIMGKWMCAIFSCCNFSSRPFKIS